MLTVYDNPEFQSFGVFCAIGSAVVNVFHAIFSGMLVHSANFDILVIMLTTSLPAAMSLFPAFFYWEYSQCTWTHKISNDFRCIEINVIL